MSLLEQTYPLGPAMISFPAGDRQTPMHMHTVKTTPYDILRREVSSAIWLETSPDLVTAKSRIKEIASFWPGSSRLLTVSPSESLPPSPLPPRCTLRSNTCANVSANP